MKLKVLAAAIFVAGCIAAAAGGAFVASRQNGAAQPAATAAPVAAPAAQPVSETEGVVASPQRPAEAEAPAAERTMPVAPPAPKAEPRRERPAAPASQDRRAGAPPRTTPAPVVAAPDRPQERPAVTAPPVEPVTDVRVPDPPPAPPEPQFEELVVPVSSVIGLQVETPLSSERSRVEDRVDARVTRDVTAAGRVAIPAGSRVIGAVSLVDRGGKMKGAARLGVRFHTLVLADGREVPLRTEAVYREGDSPGNESARKIGGAAIGGAILGAIMGGGKGAAIGGAAGAGAGSAAVMAGDRNAATLPAGTVVNVRLSAPAAIEVEKR
ncbi:MAG: hypothetical protein ACM30E_03265 [Nitrososphaerales archaeon]